MDPALREILRLGKTRDIEAVMRLDGTGRIPAGVRVISRFGDVVTCRVPRQKVRRIWSEDYVVSLKAARIISQDPYAEDNHETRANGACKPVPRRPRGLPETGRGTVIAILDWGLDFAHPAFLDAQGQSRIAAIWDQGCTGNHEPYGYGRVFDRAEINAALSQADPYQALGYFPQRADPHGKGAHGTHVASIAAGSAYEGGEAGIACEADIIFVHLDLEQSQAPNLGSSVRLLEGLDWIRTIAGDRKLVVNLSVGRHGGPHNGLTLVERAFDAFLLEKPGRSIVQSCGNYFEQNIHAAGRLAQGHTKMLRWHVPKSDVTPNELEFWYSASDRFHIQLQPPKGQAIDLPFGGEAPVTINGVTVGYGYHRLNDPAAGDHHVEIFLYPDAPSGEWRVLISAQDIRDGTWHAWVERDSGGAVRQSRLHQDDSTPLTTTNTICNGFYTIAVGAYNACASDFSAGRFSSSGPTRDGRDKPTLAAPGVNICAAKSARHARDAGAPKSAIHSGTSMAAPHVTGTLALMHQAAAMPIPADQSQAILTSTCVPAVSHLRHRLGAGYLNIKAAVKAARGIAASKSATRDTVDAKQEINFISQEGSAMKAREENFQSVLAALNIEPGRHAIIARAGAELPPLLTGDVIVRQSPYEPNLAFHGSLSDADLRSRSQIVGDNLKMDQALSGLFAQLGDGSLAGWRRIADTNGRLTLGHTILRRRADAQFDELDGEDEASATSDLDEAFFPTLILIARALDANPEHMLAVMMAESGIRATAHNRNGNAVGLIQFMPETLRQLGWRDGSDTFRQLSATEQLAYVNRYYRPWKRFGLGSTGRLYQATFLPATMSLGSAPDTVICERDGRLARAYAANSGLDRARKGYITVGDLDAAIARHARGARWESALTRLRSALRTSPSQQPASPSAPAHQSRGRVNAGRAVLQTLPLLQSHHGTGPDLVLRWNAMTQIPESVDVVIHFHGYSGHGAAMQIDRHKERISGLDFSNPEATAESGRTVPTLGILPRGNFFGGRNGNAFNFPALTSEGSLNALIEASLQNFGRAIGASSAIRRNRLILTAHSGGGAALVRLIQSTDPDEIHCFDALYGDASPIAQWVASRIARGLAPSSALRIIYRAQEGTARNSESVARLMRQAVSTIDPAIATGFRVEATSIPHGDIPRRCGWILLRDARSDLPSAHAGHTSLSRQRPLPAPAPSHQAGLPEVHLDHSGARRDADTRRPFRLSETDAPRRTGSTPAARAQNITAITHYLDSTNPQHRRYQPTPTSTYCNIYAYDFCCLAGVYLPRVWWMTQAIRRLRAGETVAPSYGHTVHELNANALHDWFRNHGASFGWRQAADVDELQTAANAGEVCIIVAHRRGAGSGHISAVIPEETELAALRRDGRVVHPIESQAGRNNARAVRKTAQWWANAQRYSSFGLWIHA